MIGFTSQQLERLQDAASLLPEHRRHEFIRSVGNRIIATHDRLIAPTDVEVENAVVLVLSLNGISAPRRKLKLRQHQQHPGHSMEHCK